MAFITTRTPFRVSFFGGGTDYPIWYKNNGGAVLSAAIDKYCYITCRYLPPFFPTPHRIVWSHIENVSSISEILHPAIRECLLHMGFSDEKGIELHHHSDLPARAGMGSSSAFANGLILALTKLKNEDINQQDLFLKSIELEQDVLKENVGSQDQVATAVGGINIIHFGQDEKIEVKPIEADTNRLANLESRLMLVYTGISRHASKVAKKFIQDLSNRKSELEKMRSLVDEAHGILTGDHNLDDFGALLHESWELKRSLSNVVSNQMIDTLYQTAIDAGAIGGKLLGAGSSGFMLFYIDPDKRENVKHALQQYLNVDMRFDFEGSHVIRYG